MGVSESPASPRIWFDRDELHIECESLFGPGGEAQVRRLARRVFVLPEVRSLGLEPEAGKAVVRSQTRMAERKEFLGRLADAMGGAEEGLDDGGIPPWTTGESVILHRFGGIVSKFEISGSGPGRLYLRHGSVSRDPAARQRVEEAARNVPGVRQADASAAGGKLRIDYLPEATDVRHLIRAVEAQLRPANNALVTLNPAPARMGLANATLGLATVGELALPGVLPICIGMLVVSNLSTIGDAGRQLGQGKLGLPVLYTALLGCSITTGQIVAHALMEWSFRFWERRSNIAIADECRTIIEENLSIPDQARLVRSEQVDAKVSSDLLRVGHRIRIDESETIPADGRVAAGSALVDETAVRGSLAPVRKSCGDEVLAGSKVLAGQIEMEIQRTGSQTRAALIAHSVISTARGLSREPVLRRRAEAMADRAVPSTLAIAGVGWAVGGLFAVGAVLHQDYASGPNLTVPMETLRAVKLALRKGAVVRLGSALPRLAESRFIVLDDHPAWTMPGVELENLYTRLAESDRNSLLGYVAGAGLYLGDQRSDALADACHRLGMVVRQPPLVSLGPERLAVRQGGHAIVLRNGADELEEGAPVPLTVEIDGTEVALLKFRYCDQPRAAQSVSQLRRKGIEVFLLSSRPERETEQVARRLGVELYSGDFSAEEKIRFLQGLRRRGVLAALVGNRRIPVELANEAHVSVSLGGTEGLAGESADIVVLGDSLDALVDSMALAEDCDERIRGICRRAWLPNLLCIAGGYAGVLNGITSGLIANVGVSRVYQRAARSLRESLPPPGFKRIGA